MNKKGREESIVIPERLEIFFHLNIVAQITAAITAILKCKITKTPNKVEIPFPPLNRKNIENTCPKTTIIAEKF